MGPGVWEITAENGLALWGWNVLETDQGDVCEMHGIITFEHQWLGVTRE